MTNDPAVSAMAKRGNRFDGMQHAARLADEAEARVLRCRATCRFTKRAGRFAAMLAIVFSVMLLNFAAATAQETAATRDDGARPASVAYDGMLEVSGKEPDGETALLLKFDGKPDYRLFFMDRPDRLVLEFNKITLGFDSRFAARTGGLVQQLRFGSITADRSRLVVALSAAAEIRQQALEADAETGRYSLRLVLGGIEQALFSKRVTEQQALPPNPNYVMVEMLRYAGGLRDLKSDAGGKTGTTNDYVDGWFMGVTPGLVVGTWVGGEDKWIRFRNLLYGQGAYMAKPFFREFIKTLEGTDGVDYDPNATFYRPPGDLSIELDCAEYEKDIVPLEEGQKFEDEFSEDIFEDEFTSSPNGGDDQENQ